MKRYKHTIIDTHATCNTPLSPAESTTCFETLEEDKISDTDDVNEVEQDASIFPVCVALQRITECNSSINGIVLIRTLFLNSKKFNT